MFRTSQRKALVNDSRQEKSLEAGISRRARLKSKLNAGASRLLSVYFNNSDEEKIDSKDMILNKLKPVIAPQQMSTNFYIGTIDEGIKILEKNV